MKKSILLSILCFSLIAPIMFFAGCGNKNSAKNITNKTYYVTKLTKDANDITSSVTAVNMRIFFGNENFKLEMGSSADTASYGYYIGTYNIEKDQINLTITKYSGTLSSASSSSTKSDYVLKKLTYKNEQLSTEFINRGYILQYIFELPKE